MRTQLHDRRDGYLVVTVSFEPGESWTHDPGGTDLGDGFRDTSGHIGFYLDGQFQTTYVGHPPYVVGRAAKGIQPITGRRDRHPAAELTVRCQQAGRLFYILRRGIPETSLEYRVLDAGESQVVPKPGKLVYLEDPDAFVLIDQPSDVVTPDRRALVFWDR